MLGAEGR